jgi:hypothetical protein
MTKKIFNFSIELEDHLFTTHDILKREDHNVVVLGSNCLQTLMEFEGKLTMKAVQEWLLLSHAIDQSCSYRINRDDHKILEEILAGRLHNISWYVENCQKH